MITITLKGREIPLQYSTYEMLTIQNETGGRIVDVVTCLTGRDSENEQNIDRIGSVKHLETLAKVVRILGNAGLEAAGEKPDLTEESILRAIKPTPLDIIKASNACLDAMAEGMASELPPKEEDGPVDVVLEEMNKKKDEDK